MGGNQSDISSIGTAKGEGYRILNVRSNSPLDGQVDIFFDFIIDIIPSKQPQRNPKQILSKLTDNDQRKPTKIVKKLQQIFTQNLNQTITFKIVSTKYRNVKTIQAIPNKNWNGTQDLMGIQTRLQRYDEAFQTYFPFSDIRPSSPIKKANIIQGDFLIGCKQFKYNSINQLLENIYQRYYDKAIQNKTINLAVYNLSQDVLKIVPVILARGWGDKGLLGCQFLEGHLNRFPKNLASVRQELKMKKKQSDDTHKIKKQLSECNGASVQLIQSLKAQKNKKKKNVQNLKKILLIQPSKNFQPPKKQQKLIQQKQISMKKQGSNTQNKIQNVQNVQQYEKYVSYQKFEHLANRVATLQQMLSNVRNYIQNLNDSDQEA